MASLELVRLFQGSHCVVWAGSKCEENLWVWLSQAVSPCHSISPSPPLPSVDSKSKRCQGRHSSTLLTFPALQCTAVEKQVTEVPGIHALLHWSVSSKQGRLAGALMSYQSPVLSKAHSRSPRCTGPRASAHPGWNRHIGGPKEVADP